MTNLFVEQCKMCNKSSYKSNILQWANKKDDNITLRVGRFSLIFFTIVKWLSFRHTSRGKKDFLVG